MILPTGFKVPFYRAGLALAPALFFRIQHIRMHRRFGSHWYWPNLTYPRTFNEKLMRSKLLKEHMGLEHLVDKAQVKQWVAERIGAGNIIPTIGVYGCPDSIPIEDLPRPCILKPTHTSGHVVILCGTAEEPKKELITQQLARWLRVNHYQVSGEPQYKSIPPRIICEPLLGDTKENLPDFKFFCFGGRPTFVQVDLDRYSNHVRCFYNAEWKRQEFTLRYPKAEQAVACPKPFKKMLDIARILSSDFTFVRVDLYAVEDRVYFGELTFHPESGVAPFSDYQVDLDFGRRLG